MGFGIGSCSNAVNGWASEVANWAPGSNDWNPAAGHFTQIVWRSTTAVGCGVADCGGRGQFLVCQYNPAGEMALGLAKKAGNLQLRVCVPPSGPGGCCFLYMEPGVRLSPALLEHV